MKMEAEVKGKRKIYIIFVVILAIIRMLDFMSL